MSKLLSFLKPNNSILNISRIRVQGENNPEKPKHLCIIWYLLVSMNIQINLRMPEKLLKSARTYSEEHGFSNVQEFIKETLRERLFEEPPITKEELFLVNKLTEAAEKEKLYGTEEELFKKLRRK